jgi:ABC-2 type transport system ATP-binding protein
MPRRKTAMPTPEFAIQVRDLRKTYAGNGKMPAKHALNGITLEIPTGSIFGLLGPNGAGKSTFINILAGLVKKTSGTARIWDLDIDEHPRQSRAAIGVVNQEVVADPFFTPFEMLELMAGFYGVPKAERRSVEILTALGLGDKKDAYVRQLSGGMKRRLMWDYVRELHDKGTTIILTTHYLEEAEELCDSIAIVDKGAIVACEPTARLLSRLDYKTLIITPREPVTAIPPELAMHDPKLRPDGTLAITFKTAETGIGRLLEKARAAGISIADLSTKSPDLEDVFIALTGDRAPVKSTG